MWPTLNILNITKYFAKCFCKDKPAGCKDKPAGIPPATGFHIIIEFEASPQKKSGRF